MEKYRGKIGPAEAMSALAPAFNVAYADAARMLMAVVEKFEKDTGRVVDSIALDRIDISTIASVGRTVRQASLHFLPTPQEVAW